MPQIIFMKKRPAKSPGNFVQHQAFWQYDPGYWLNYFHSSGNGLSITTGAEKSRNFTGHNGHSLLLLFLRQFKSPLTLLLVVAVLLSFLLNDRSGGSIMLFILLTSAILSFLQEKNAGKIIEKLQALLSLKSTVLRDGKIIQIDSSGIFPGDLVLLKAGENIPADCLLVETNELHINESVITGESYPVKKEARAVPGNAALPGRVNTLWQGTSVVSGTARAIAINTGSNSLLGEMRRRTQADVKTAFETGTGDFGYFLMKITLALTVLVLLVNLVASRAVLEAAIFSLALAVGMAPELLPAVTTIAMSAGAKRMLQKKLVVKKLSSIQNLGEVNLLCSDKTGTVTEGKMQIAHFYDFQKSENFLVKKLAVLNAMFETGYYNPIDAALKEFVAEVNITGIQKIAEIPYDFTRKRLSVAVEETGQKRLITKGSFLQIKHICSQVIDGNELRPIGEYEQQLDDNFDKLGRDGYRVIAVCYKDITDEPINQAAETGMIFAGFVLMNDPVKPGIAAAIHELDKLGVGLKIITGDNKNIAWITAKEIGIAEPKLITGKELDSVSNEGMEVAVKTVDIFAEIEPLQKERIINALKKTYTVAYIGDGINDIAAIHAADTGISVNNAVDVAREAADLVMTNKDLMVLADGIREGRKTFANTLKYIHISTGSTFGNMCSVALASLFLPFLPMLPKQILFTNFITDFPYLAIASDKVDEAELQQPGKWNIKIVRNYMLFFGMHSTVFDMITFFTLLVFYHTDQSTFQTAWLEVSIISELCILFVIRTRLGLFKSMPSLPLLILTGIAILLTILVPYLPVAELIGIKPLPLSLVPVLLTIIFAYTFTAGLLKKWFYKTYAGTNR